LNFRFATAADAAALVAELRNATRVAVDTEFHPERRYLPQLYLVQLYTGNGPVWLVDPLLDGFIAQIAEALRQPTWVVHGGQQDLRILGAALGGIPENVLDTQIAAGLVGPRYPAGYGQLTNDWLQQPLDKGATLSDWSRRPLSPAQVHYAAHDVLHLLDLWDRLHAEATRRGRDVLLADACREARDLACAPDLNELWREIPGHAGLSPQQAAVLRALCRWRDARARVEDLGPRNLVADNILLDLAKRQPRDSETIGEDRRLSKSFLKRCADDLVACIHEARHEPEAAWPFLVKRETCGGRVASLLELVAECEGARLGFATRLVAPRTRLEQLTARSAAEREATRRILGPWRDALVGDAVYAAHAGQTTLRCTPDDVDLVPTGADAN
jgi:ribonuclease D